MNRPTVRGDDTILRFDDFDLAAYDRFLAVKRLPEKRLSHDWRDGSYTVTIPTRLAHLLDPSIPPPTRPEQPLAEHLFDYQAWITRRALEAKRFAVWLDTGLGKTAVLLEFARQVADRTGGRVLILSPPAVIEQTRAQAAAFYGELPIERLSTRDQLADWCTRPGPGLAVTNYQKLVGGQLPELRRLAGLVLDESSVLRTGGGTIKWNLIKSARGVEYKLSCTATPAPNETMEYASQAAFLETIRHEGQVLWTWFRRDQRGEWSVKPHARSAFYRWMSSWSIYLRDPSRFGWKDVLAELPEPEWLEERLELTPAQRDAMHDVMHDMGAAGGMFPERVGVRERAKLAQLARGFLYEGAGPGRGVRRVESVKPGRVAEITRSEVAAGRATIVWTVFDAESRIVADLLADLAPVVVDGSVPEDDRAPALARFLDGHTPVLISKAQVGGYGLNLQCARSMVFSGFDDSQERMYQAVRRAYRYGQTHRVRVFVPYVPELEGLMYGNVRAKEARFAADVATQEHEYIQVIKGGVA